MTEIELPKALPYWAKWIARDYDGELYAHEFEPYIYGDEWYGDRVDAGMWSLSPEWPHLNDPDWTKNIMEVKR